MRKNASSRIMDEDLKIFLGIKPEVEEQKPAPAGMPAQEHEDVQAGMDENMSEQTGEAVQAKYGWKPAGGTPCQRQATQNIAGGIQGNVPPGTVHRRPEARVPQPRHTRCPRPHRQPVRQSQDERVGTDGEHRPSPPCHLQGRTSRHGVNSEN